MISGKHITKITIALISLALLLCVLAMGFYDKLIPVISTKGYALEYETTLFDTNQIIEMNIQMDDDKWSDLLLNATSETYYECDVTINGTTFYRVGIRPKGNTSLSSIAKDPDNNRYSFKLEFDRFVDGQTCFGLDKLILNNNYADATNMKEAIIYDMFQFLDADASLYNYAKVSVNGNYWGVYLALEAVEDSFMLRNNGTKKGNLYKPDSMNFNNTNGGDKSSGKNEAPSPGGGFKMPEQRGSTKNGGGFRPNFGARPDEATADASNKQGPQTNEGSGQKRPASNQRNFAEAGPRMGRGGMPGGMGGGGNLNYTDDNIESYGTIWNGSVTNTKEADHKRVVTALKNVNDRTNIEDYVDIEQILKYMAVHNFSVNDDSLSGSMAHNYYLYEADGKISILPWDYNLSLGGMHGGSATDVINEPIDDLWQGTKFFGFVLENGAYTARYHTYYEKLINEYFYGGRFEETYHRIRSQIDSLVESDPNAMYSYDAYTKAADLFYEVVMLRAESIKGQLEGTIPSTKEEQNQNPSSLVDASSVNLSDLGQFMMGGGRGPGNQADSLNAANKPKTQ